MQIKSSAFEANQTIPRLYTCDGRDIAPPLTWTGIPSETNSLSLIIDDPDAPDPAAPRTIWVHWILYNLPPDCSGLDEDASNAALPEGTCQGLNDWHRTGYGGPCPPVGRHRYFFKLYALDCMLPDLHRPTKDELLKAMRGHVLAEAELMATYVR